MNIISPQAAKYIYFFLNQYNKCEEGKHREWFSNLGPYLALVMHMPPPSSSLNSFICIYYAHKPPPKQYTQ